MAVTATTPELLEPWVTKIFHDELTMQEPLYPKVFNVTTSTKAFEDTFAVSGLGTFALKPEGTRISYDDPVQSGRKRTVHSTFARGFQASMELMADEQFGIIAKMPKDLGKGARDHKERKAWNVLNQAFNNTAPFQGIPEGDNAARNLCSTAHVRLKDGGNSDNTVNPAVTLSVSGMQSAVTNMRLTQDDSGRFSPLTPKLLIIHPNDEWTAVQILDSVQEPFTADNQVNTMATSRMGITFLAVPYLTDTNNWFLTTNKSDHSLTWYNRMEMETSSNKDSQSKDMLYDAVYRASATFDRWYGVVGSNP
jgi:phage major head subunit gpT-like protein